MKCNKHPKYKAIRKPTANCSKCHAMFAETLRQRELEEAVPLVENENSIRLAKFKKEQENKEIEKALAFYALCNKIDNMDPYWRGVTIVKDRNSDEWKIESSVWIDNGYGGNLSTTSATGRTIQEAMKLFLSRVEDKDNRCKAGYM